MTVRVATRASALATAQSGWVAERIAAVLDRPVELITVSTLGDESDAPLDSFGSVGVFVSAVRQAVIDGRAEVAVHSLKDLPTAPHPDLVLAASKALQQEGLNLRERVRETPLLHWRLTGQG